MAARRLVVELNLGDEDVTKLMAMTRSRTEPASRVERARGSWLNLIEGFFSKLARSVLRHIRVASKQELKDRIPAAIDDINQQPVVHTWSYKLDKAP